MSAAEPWLPSLIVPTPQAGFDLAVKLARTAVKATRSSGEVRTKLRAAYEQDTAQLIAASGVVAAHFAAMAAANGYWREPAS